MDDSTRHHPSTAHRTPPGAAPRPVLRLHDEVFDVAAQIFPDLVHLHYGLGDPDSTERGLRGLVGRLREGSERLLERTAAVADMRSWAQGRRGLDLGCGLGGTSTWLRQRFDCSMVGLNLNLSQLRLARSRLQAGSTPPALVCGDGLRLPLATGSVDFVIGIEVAFHVRDKAALLSEVARVLRPGGSLVLVDEEWPGGLDVLGLMFYPPFGGYADLAAGAGLELLRYEELGPGVGVWMDDYARVSAPAFLALVALQAALRGRPRLAWRYLRGLHRFDQAIRAERHRWGVHLSPLRPLAGVQRVREHLAARLRSGGLRHGVWVCRKG